MTREQIIENNELVEFITQSGGELKQSGSQLVTNHCPVSGHKPGHLCVSINPEKQVWHCNDCEKGGSVIDWVVFEQQVNADEAIKILSGDASPETFRSGEAGGSNPRPVTRRDNVTVNGEPTTQKEIMHYNYTDENGSLLYQVVRYEPKTFRQRQEKNGKWQYDLLGVTRVLYNLPNVLKAKTVCVTEGEKDADNLNAIGFVATTNSGGSKNWMAAYADYLKNKDVIVFEDNDPAGKAWADNVVESCRDKAASVKRMKFPGCKDVSEWLDSLEGKGPADKQAMLQSIIDNVPHVVDPIPVYSIYEMEEQFAVNINDPRRKSFSMSSFSSKFKNINNNLMPGEVVMIVGDTSQGKTAFMQAIAMAASPMKALLFELELPLDAMFTRYVQMQRKCYESDIINGYKSDPAGRYAAKFDKLQNVWVCPEAGLSMNQIEKIIIKSELKLGERPPLVFLDYMGLVGAEYGQVGYEAMAAKANQSKVVAKRSNTIVFIGSQVSRPPGSKEHVQDVKIHHAKGAGELENSSNLVLGISRPEEKLLKMKVLKNTRGPIGAEIEFDFDPGKLQITERP